MDMEKQTEEIRRKIYSRPYIEETLNSETRQNPWEAVLAASSNSLPCHQQNPGGNMSNTVNLQTVRSDARSSDGENLCRIAHPVVDCATIHQEGIKNPYHEQEIQNLYPGMSSRDETRFFASLSLVGVLLLLLDLLDRIYHDLRNDLASRILAQILRRV